MAKHSQPFIEVVTRFYVPLNQLPSEFQEIRLGDLLNMPNEVEIYDSTSPTVNKGDLG